MADRELCAFCHDGEEAGPLRNTHDDKILAHYNCLIYSPLVITDPQPDSDDSVTLFNITSVKKEIKRGKKLKCSFCKRIGATIGCYRKACKKTYHYLCAIKAGGEHITHKNKELYITCCKKHKKHQEEKTAQGSLFASSPKSCDNKTRKKKIRKKKDTSNEVRKKLTFGKRPVPGTVQNTNGEQRSTEQSLDNPTNEEDVEIPGPSITHNNFPFRIQSDSDVESHDSAGSRSSGIGNKQNTAGRISNLGNPEDMETSGPSTSMVYQNNEPITIGSDSDDDFPLFNGSQLVNLKKEGKSANDNETVTSSPSGALRETFPSPPRERTSSTNSSDATDLELHNVLSLSGFPKKNRKRKRKRNNPQLETALLTMDPEERGAYSQLYDAVGGSFDPSQDISTYDDCGNEETEDSSNVTMEDISKDQNNCTNNKADGSAVEAAASESSVVLQGPGRQSASFTTVNDTASSSQLPRHSVGLQSSSSKSIPPLSLASKVKNANKLRGPLFHPADAANSSDRSSSTSAERMTYTQPADSDDINTRTQPKDTHGEGKLDESSSAVFRRPVQPSSDQPLSSSSTRKSLYQEQLINPLNIEDTSNKRKKKATKTKNSVLADLRNTMKKHAAQRSSFPVGTPSKSKSLCPSNTNSLSDKELLHSSSTKTPGKEHFKSPNSWGLKASPGISRATVKEFTRHSITTNAIVHADSAHNPGLSEDTTTKVQSQSKDSATEMSASSPTPKKACISEDPQMMETSTPREEASATYTGVRADNASEVQNKTFSHLTPLKLKALSAQLKEDDVASERSPGLSTVPQQTLNCPSNVNQNLETSGDVTSKRPPEHSIVFQQTENDVSNVIRNHQNPGQTEDEPPSPGDLLEGEPISMEEERTYTDGDAAPLSDSGQTEDEPPSPGDLLEGEPISMEEERTYTDGDAAPLSDDPAKKNSRTGDKEPYSESPGTFTRDEDHYCMESGSPEYDIEPNSPEHGMEPNLPVDGIEPNSSKDGIEPKSPEHGMEPNLPVDGIEPNSSKDGIEPNSSEHGMEPNLPVDQGGAEIKWVLKGKIAHSLVDQSSPHSALSYHLVGQVGGGGVWGETQQQTLLFQLQQNQDGDEAFATSLVQFLRKIPEDKKLTTRMAILNVLLSALDQQDHGRAP